MINKKVENMEKQRKDNLKKLNTAKIITACVFIAIFVLNMRREITYTTSYDPYKEEIIFSNKTFKKVYVPVEDIKKEIVEDQIAMTRELLTYKKNITTYGIHGAFLMCMLLSMQIYSKIAINKKDEENEKDNILMYRLKGKEDMKLYASFMLPVTIIIFNVWFYITMVIVMYLELWISYKNLSEEEKSVIRFKKGNRILIPIILSFLLTIGIGEVENLLKREIDEIETFVRDGYMELREQYE